MRKERSLDRLMEAVRAAGFSMAGEPTEGTSEQAGHAKGYQDADHVMPGPLGGVETASPTGGDARGVAYVRSLLPVPVPAGRLSASHSRGAGLPETIMATGWLTGRFAGFLRQPARG